MMQLTPSVHYLVTKLAEVEAAMALMVEQAVAKRKELAEAIQVRVSEYPTHANLGQYNVPMARRTSISGNLESPAPVFWNVRKKQ